MRYPRVFFSECFGFRKKGCCVAILAESQINKIKGRPGYISKKVAHLRLVESRADRRLALPSHSMSVRGRNVYLSDQRFVRHTIVAIRMVRRNAAFITEEEMNIRPFNSTCEALRGKQFAQLSIDSSASPATLPTQCEPHPGRICRLVCRCAIQRSRAGLV